MLKIQNLLCIFPFLFSFISCSTLNNAKPQANPQVSNCEALPKIREYMFANEENGFSGTVLVAKSDEVLCKMALGKADRERDIEMTHDTVLDTGSLTKQFTAAAILKLVEQGKLNLNDPLKKFFPSIPSDKENITVHQLLTHSSGISSYTGDDYEQISRDKFLQELFARPLVSKPGEKYEYANLGYSLLGMIIEGTSNLTYEEYIYLNLFKPAKMESTGYLRPNWKQQNLAQGYDRITGVKWGTSLERWRKNQNKVSWNLFANGGLFSTVEDLYRWHLALRKGTILSNTSLALMETPYIPEDIEGSSFYGYGWAISDLQQNDTLVAHSGSNEVFFADFHHLKNSKITVILLSNQEIRGVGQIAENIWKMLKNENFSAAEVEKPYYLYLQDFLNVYDDKNRIELNQDFNNKTKGRNPIYIAALTGNLEAVNFLIEQDYRVDQKTKHGSEPLSAASYYGHQVVVKRLLALGSDVNATNKRGRTSLMSAARACQSDIIDLLIKHGADINIQESKGNRALDYAKMSKCEASYNVLSNKN